MCNTLVEVFSVYVIFSKLSIADIFKFTFKFSLHALGTEFSP